MMSPSKVEQRPSQPNVFYSPRKLENINCVLAKTESEGALYIGDTVSTLKREYLVDNRIEAVLRCNKEACNFIFYPANHLVQTDFHI